MNAPTAEAEPPPAGGETPPADPDATPNGDGGAHTPDQPGEGDEAAPTVPTLEIDGAGSQLSFSVGGQKPESSTVKMRGGKINVRKGELKKGETIDLLVKVQVAEIHFVDKRDGQTGEIVGTERRHIVKPISVEKVV